MTEIILTILNNRKQNLIIERIPINLNHLTPKLYLLHKYLLLHVPHLQWVIHQQTRNEVGLRLMQLDVGHTDLTKGEDLLEFQEVCVKNVDMRVTRVCEPIGIRCYGLLAEETGTRRDQLLYK